MNALTWLAVPALPLLVALMRAVPGMRKAVPALVPAAVAPALAVAAWDPSPVEITWLLLGSVMGLDAVGRTFLLLTALLWGAAALFCRGYMKRDPRRDSFMTYFLLTMSGNLWLIIARDPATFYTSFALMTFAAYGLVVHTRTREAVRAGRIYLVMAVLGEICIASGLWMLVVGGWDIDLAAVPAERLGVTFFLLLAGFGIKAGVLPLHVWLPLAHPVAPTPASAVLSGAMIKAGLLGWLRFLPSHGPEEASVMVAVGLGGAFGGAAYGLLQRNPKTILAYSSVSQMGWLVIGVATFVAAPSHRVEASAAIALYALHHGLVKGSLFLSAGLSAPRGGLGSILRRAGQSVLALAMAAAPFTGGAAAKHAIKELVPFLPGPWPQLLPGLLSAAAAATALLMIRFLAAVWVEREDGEASDAWQWAAWLPLVIASFVLPMMAARGAPVPGGLAGALAPLLAASLLALLAAGLLRRRGAAAPELPAGDLLIPFEALSRRLLSLWKRPVGPLLGGWRRTLYSFQWHEPQELPLMIRVLDAGEGWWGRWSVCGFLFLAGLITAAFLLLPRGG